jgi:hypothetical protein
MFVVKPRWSGDCFSVKLYIEDLLKSYENSKIGSRIRTITINAVACADDIALVSDNPHDLQILVNQADWVKPIFSIKSS